MAVYTQVSEEALSSLLATYDIGALKTYSGITQGVENTNYLLTTSSGKFILTLFERRANEADLPFFIKLMNHLSARGVPAPSPIADANGDTLQILHERPAIIVSFLPGAVRMTPDVSECRALGEMLARMHVASNDFTITRKNDLGLDGWRRLAAHCAPRAAACSRDLRTCIDDEISFLSRHWPANLSTGVIHADLFPDNVFFDGAGVSGVIDFYFACTDYLVYDLAVSLNSWAGSPKGWSHENATAMIAGYESVRRLSRAEVDALPIMLRGSATRFLLTRLYDWLNQVEGAVVSVKDPLEYRDILLFHRSTAPSERYRLRDD